MQRIRDAAQRLQCNRKAWADRLHPDVWNVIGHLHLPFLDWLAGHSEYQGQYYTKRLMDGKPTLGDIPPSGAFKPERNEATMTLHQWASNPRQRNQRMIDCMASTGDAMLDAESWAKTMTEAGMRYRQGPGELSDLDVDKVCLTPRWPKWEQKKMERGHVATSPTGRLHRLMTR